MQANITNLLALSSIKPVAGSFVTVEQRKASKDAEDKPNLFVSYFLPELLNTVQHEELKQFCVNAYEAAVVKHARQSLKDGKLDFIMPSLADLSKPKKREFTFTKALVQDWLDNYAFAIINAAIASKMQQGINSAAVVKKALKYSALFTALAGGSVIPQVDLNAMGSALEIMEKAAQQGLASIPLHPFTNSVIDRLGVKQQVLTDFLAAQSMQCEASDFI